MPVEIDRSGRRACTPRLGPSTSSAPPPPRLMSVSENTVRQIKSKLMQLIAHLAQHAAECLLGDDDAEFLENPLPEIDDPPAHDPMNRRDRPLSRIAASAVRCASLSHGCCPGALRSIPSGPSALNLTTQSRTT